MTDTEVLKREIATFEGMKDELERHHDGKYVVIHGDELVGAFDTIDAAATEAVRRIRRGPYLIRRVGEPPLALPASVYAASVRHADR